MYSFFLPHPVYIAILLKSVPSVSYKSDIVMIGRRDCGMPGVLMLVIVKGLVRAPLPVPERLNWQTASITKTTTVSV